MLSTDWFLVNTARGLGAAGELKIAEALETQGYQVDAIHPYQWGDLRAFNPQGEVFYIEVKTARASRSKTRKGFNFSLYRKIRGGRVCTDHRNTDYTILLCVFRTGECEAFVIPTGQIARVTQITIPTDTRAYAGKYRQYRQSLKELRLR